LHWSGHPPISLSCSQLAFPGTDFIWFSVLWLFDFLVFYYSPSCNNFFCAQSSSLLGFPRGAPKSLVPASPLTSPLLFVFFLRTFVLAICRYLEVGRLVPFFPPPPLPFLPLFCLQFVSKQPVGREFHQTHGQGKLVNPYFPFCFFLFFFVFRNNCRTLVVPSNNVFFFLTSRPSPGSFLLISLFFFRPAVRICGRCYPPFKNLGAFIFTFFFLLDHVFPLPPPFLSGAKFMAWWPIPPLSWRFLFSRVLFP